VGIELLFQRRIDYGCCDPVTLILGLGLDCTGLGKMFKTICLEPLFCILS